MGRITVPHGSELPRRADVVIVGGGITGCASAFYATEAGFDTVVLERREGLGTLTTAACDECFRAQFDEPENIQMMLESISVFEDFAELVRVPNCDLGLHQQGYLFLTAVEETAARLQERVRKQQSYGLLDVGYVPGDVVREQFPYVGQQVVGATFRAKDGWLSVHELAQGFAKGSAALFALQTAATGISLDGQGVSGVLTTRGGIATRCAVVAAGPFSNVVLSWVDVALPLTLLRRHKVVLAGVPQVPADAPMTIDQDIGAFWRPEVGGAALGWSLPEEPAEPMERVPTDWSFPAVALEGVARLVPFWTQVAQALKREQVFLSAGQYTCTPDHKPIIGPVGGVPGLFASVGYSGHGVMASPGGARQLVDCIIDPAGRVQNPFRGERFAADNVDICAESLIL